MSSHPGYEEYVVYRAPWYCYRRAVHWPEHFLSGHA
jgi:hypothetical protein